MKQSTFTRAVIVLAVLASAGSAVLPQLGAGEEKSLQELLPRLKPLEPREALQSFQIEQGFRVELVAAEPDVVDPIAVAFDEQFRMYVCEDLDYPFPAEEGKEPISRVRLLEDLDRDGRYERSTVFADQVHWPSGVVCYQGGVFVAAPPQIIYLKDTDGDRRADVREVVYDGFGTATAEDIMNNLKWGLDNRIYGVASYNGGEVHREGDDRSSPISVRGSSFRFDPVTFKFERLPGTGDFGNCFDDWGNRFVTNAGMLLMHPVYSEPYLARNPHLHVGNVLYRCASNKRDMYSISPPEPWRVVRKRFWNRWVNTTKEMRAARFSAAELAERGFVTGAAGAAIYRGDVYAADYSGNSFTSEPAGNVVIRLRLKPNGITFDAKATSEKTEFLASTDNWFRPVNVANGPDGCLYVCDMYRELIEDPSAIPADILNLMDVTSGRDRGRIYRIVPENFKRPRAPSLAKVATVDLVAQLKSRNAWTRETAQRLLVERRDKPAAAALRKLITDSDFPQARLHALWTLEAIAGSDESTMRRALHDDHPAVREYAVRIAERQLNSLPAIAEQVASLASDKHARVRYQVAFSLGQLSDRDAAIPALAVIVAGNNSNEHIRTAVLSSVPDDAARLLEALAKRDALADAAGFAADLVSLIAARGDRAEVDQAVAFANSEQVPLASRYAVTLQLAQGVARSGNTFQQTLDRQTPEIRQRFDRLLQQAQGDAVDPEKAAELRGLAIQLLRFGDWSQVSRTLFELLSAQQPTELQLAAIQTVSTFENDEATAHLIAGWRGLSPRVRSEAAEAMLSQSERAKALLQAIHDNKIPAADLAPARQQLLLQHRDTTIRTLAAEVLGSSQRPARSKVIEQYQATLELSGNAEQGGNVFKTNCATCHVAKGQGKAVGPDLATVQNRTPQQLLLQILDPNREVKPQYHIYQVTTDEGRIKSGIIASETAASITLRRAEGAEDIIPRQSIDTLRSTGLSLMPEGLEKKISPQQMADLLAYLKSLK